MGFPIVQVVLLVVLVVTLTVVNAVRPASRRALSATWKRDRALRVVVYLFPLLIVAIIAYRIAYG